MIDANRHSALTAPAFRRHGNPTDTRCVFDVERRTLHATASAETARRTIRLRLRRFLADAPGVWLGRKLTPGVIGLGLGDLFLLEAIPPDRTLIANRKSPIVVCRIVPREAERCEIRLSIFPYAFPWSVVDPPAVAFFDDWLSGVASAVGATINPVG